MSEKYVVRLKNAAIYHADNPFGSTSAEKLMRRGEMVLSDVNLCVAPGEFVYLIGRVGSGKSTLLKTLYAEVQLLSGDAWQATTCADSGAATSPTSAAGSASYSRTTSC